MVDNSVIIIIILLVYAAILFAIGYMAKKSTSKTPEDYFMASRSLGFFVLIMSVFGTNMTAFYMMGVPGLSYKLGFGVYGYVALGCSILSAAGLYIIGYRAWLVGKRYGYMTQPEILGARWNSSTVSLIMFVIMMLYVVPYVVTSIIGAGAALQALTQGKIPFMVGAVIITAIVTIYTAEGGMKGTAWTNVFQGIVFMSVAIVLWILIGIKMGGFSAVTEKLLTNSPDLLTRSDHFNPKLWFSYLFVAPIAVIMHPQVFVRVLSARDAVTLKRLVSFYPIMFLIAYTPVVFIGVWGTEAFPGLTGKEADSILPMMVAKYLPTFFQGLGLAGILAALMSSMDAMMLTISNMFTNDIVLRFNPNVPDEKRVWLGRLFVYGVALICLLVAYIRPGTIFAIASYAFTGEAAIIPIFILALYWKRSNKYGALAGLIVPALLLPIYEFTPYLDWSKFGFLSVVPLMVISTVITIVVSLLTPQTPEQATNRFFDIYDDTYNRRVKWSSIFQTGKKLRGQINNF